MVKKDLGFVIKRHNFRETSLITTIYTSHFGKITGILKGFYTSKREFSSPFERGSLNEITFYPKRKEIWLFSFVDLVDDYPYLRTNISKAKVASLFLSLVDKVMQLWDANPLIFDLLRQCLTALEKEDERKILYIFLIKFLTLSGFKPEINRCLNCHGNLDENLYFSISRGGLICQNCFDTVRNLQRISKEVASSLLYIQKYEFTLTLRLRPSLQCEVEMLKILGEFLSYHLDIDISGKLFLPKAVSGRGIKNLI
ncbi:MAG: DNA repair protein RecO [Candidatus Omnitrophota bacterium]|nr:MAG: DNA repair protein RecO [Candidatus Omnitrophota bacterium]